MSKNSIKVWQGEHIFVALSGIIRPSTNIKTDDMIQVYIMCNDEPPTVASESGLESLVCGNCQLRKHNAFDKSRACYVNLGHAPDAVWHSVVDDEVEDVPLFLPPVRMGAHGEPVMIPRDVFMSIVEACGRQLTGYTHQWFSMTHSERTFWQRWLMASVDHKALRQHSHKYVNDVDALAAYAQRRGWRTFSMGGQVNSIMCPNTTHGIKCVDCLLCNGTHRGNRVSIHIEPHGNGAYRYKEMTDLLTIGGMYAEQKA
jgi:hypothetical protein